MLGIYVTVPIACFRKGLTREYLETEEIPPPATCYGFLLSLVGETDRRRHVGARVTPVILSQPDLSVVLRTVWRVKAKPLGSSGNTRPDYQQLLTDVRLVIWLDSRDEPANSTTLEARVRDALDKTKRNEIVRFGGLSLGESTHLVNEVLVFAGDNERQGRAFLLSGSGRLTLPVWVDHVGATGTKYVTGELSHVALVAPNREHLPQILPNE